MGVFPRHGRKWLVFAVLLSATAAALGAYRDRLRGWFGGSPSASDTQSAAAKSGPKKSTTRRRSAAAAAAMEVLRLSPQAQRNLNLVSLPAKLQNYWRTVQIPGEIRDRPGISDRGVTSPAVGVVSAIHRFPGDSVQPGQRLFTLQLFSEYLQNTQAELFRAARETDLVQEQIERLAAIAKDGAIAEVRVLDLKNQLRRQQALIAACRQDLLTRGLTPEQIRQATEGTFVSTIEVTAPSPVAGVAESVTPRGAVDLAAATVEDSRGSAVPWELQELSVELGQQVQAGQLLAKLSNHEALFIVGRAFKQEAPFLEQAAQERRPIDVEFAEDDLSHWREGAPEQSFSIRHLANSIDPQSRTFDFFIPLQNQSHRFSRDGEDFVAWRFRPGQRTRLHVPVEEYRDVYVLPSAAVVREGAEAYVFRQSGELFDRRPVQVLHQDRRFVVIAKDGSLKPDMLLAQNSAAALNRVLRAQSAAGEEPGFHVHADGSIHGDH
ncbi:MAG: efflux RND transporter periplasmic adaptor subunit [Planctomycetaceae bacterium]